MGMGVSGFIYSTELHDLYEKHEDTILDYLDEQASELRGELGLQMVVNAITGRDCAAP